MPEVLSFEEHQSIAMSLTFPTNAFIDGRFQPEFGGSDNLKHAHDQYTELKTIWIDLPDRPSSALIDY